LAEIQEYDRDEREAFNPVAVDDNEPNAFAFKLAEQVGQRVRLWNGEPVDVRVEIRPR
jgi:hypothetical protein